MKKEDIDFLKDLQNELNTQPSDGNANPKYWGIMERKLVPVPSGCGESYIVDNEGDKYTLDEFIECINEIIVDCDEEVKEEWKCVDKTWFDEVLTFAQEFIDSDYDEVNFDLQDVLSHETGCFLTKRAAKEYIEKYSYNHSNPRTYAMTAYRNYEYGRLLKIISEMNIEDIKED